MTGNSPIIFLRFKIGLISVVSPHMTSLHTCYFCIDKEEETDGSCAEQEPKESWTTGFQFYCIAEVT